MSGPINRTAVRKAVLLVVGATAAVTTTWVLAPATSGTVHAVVDARTCLNGTISLDVGKWVRDDPVPADWMGQVVEGRFSFDADLRRGTFVADDGTRLTGYSGPSEFVNAVCMI